jgi:hypothetical protein
VVGSDAWKTIGKRWWWQEKVKKARGTESKITAAASEDGESPQKEWHFHSTAKGECMTVALASVTTVVYQWAGWLIQANAAVHALPRSMCSTAPC